MELARLARLIGAPGDGLAGAPVVSGLARPTDAGCDDLTYFDPRYCALADVAATCAAAVLTAPRDAAALEGLRCLPVDDVVTSCARASAWLTPRRPCHAAGRGVAAGASIHPGAVLGAAVDVGCGTCIEAGAVIGEGVTIGDWCTIGAGAVIAAGVSVGNRVRIGAGCAIGETGFAFVADGAQWLQMPALGGAVIEDDVTILARAVVHAGVFGTTRIGRGCALDSLVLIGHDAALGAHTVIAGHSAVAGNARIGSGCRIGGRVGIGEGVTVADGVTIGASSMVARSITQVGAAYASGWPAQPRLRWWRQVAALRRGAMRPQDNG
ncbi:MAG: UDP-3-O-(3-hydroxymyristoyl)glucosamine N-acyltransferase [Gammaproteobacteria bacterium]